MAKPTPNGAREECVQVEQAMWPELGLVCQNRLHEAVCKRCYKHSHFLTISDLLHIIDLINPSSSSSLARILSTDNPIARAAPNSQRELVGTISEGNTRITRPQT
jgi:hypothetical protein